MLITYHGHSCFRLKSKNKIVVFDPYEAAVGFTLPTLRADVVITSHDHYDHHAVDKVKPTARRDKPYLIDSPGEYEVGGVSIFGTPAFHDDSQGSQRGKNTIFTVVMDYLRVCHLGDLGHALTDAQKKEIGSIDVLLIPVGGVYTIDPQVAVKTIQELEPAYAIPMHYRTSKHDQKIFDQVASLEDFLKEYGVNTKPLPQLDIDKSRLPEETEIFVLEESL